MFNLVLNYFNYYVLFKPFIYFLDKVFVTLIILKFIIIILNNYLWLVTNYYQNFNNLNLDFVVKNFKEFILFMVIMLVNNIKQNIIIINLYYY